MLPTLDEFRLARPPATSALDDDPFHLYWREGDRILCRLDRVVAGADADSFVFYLGAFARDRRRCYFLESRLNGADPERFHALNYTWFKDANAVWCIGGKVKDAHAASFEACDDGVDDLDGTWIPHSYGRDEARVFHYDFSGKANWVRKAESASFRSLGDGYFGVDARTVFCGHASIAKADVASWRKLGGFYSRDDRRIFYFNREITVADPHSFRVVPAADGRTQLARDDRHRYVNDVPIGGDPVAAARWRDMAPPEETAARPLA
ncbi:DKNYY domain-containing protein [Arenimonas terrae]|nr:DKNYY domain-containing protein [Arenimonas terrae]